MHRKLSNRMSTYVASAATVAVAAAMIAVGAPAASAAPRTIAVEGKIMGFSMKTIDVKAGEEVSICLTSPDMPHDLTVSDLNFKVASSGPSTCKTLTAPAAAGTHKYVCSVTGHAGTMFGTSSSAQPLAALPRLPPLLLLLQAHLRLATSPPVAFRPVAVRPQVCPT